MSLALIGLANGILLYGLYALDWEAGTVAFLFWYEAAVIGAVTFVKVAASLPGDVPGSSKSVTYVRPPQPGKRTRVSSSVPRIHALTALPFFLLFYGLVLGAYGALLLFALREPDYPALIERTVASGAVRLAMLVIAGQHLSAFWRDYVRGPAWQRADPTFHFWKPFGLAFVAYGAFFLGFLVLGWLQSPLVVLTVIVLLRTAADLFNTLVDAQAGEWRRAGDAATPAP